MLIELFCTLICLIIVGLIIVAVTFIGCVVYTFIHSMVSAVRKIRKDE